MPKIGVRRIDGAGWSLEPKRYEKAIRAAVNKEAKPEVLKMMREVVEGKRYSTSGDAWKHKVEFRARFQMRGNDATLYAYPTGKNKKYWGQSVFSLGLTIPKALLLSVVIWVKQSSNSSPRFLRFWPIFSISVYKQKSS